MTESALSFPVISEPEPGARGSSAAVLGPEAAAALGGAAEFVVLERQGRDGVWETGDGGVLQVCH